MFVLMQGGPTICLNIIFIFFNILGKCVKILAYIFLSHSPLVEKTLQTGILTLVKKKKNPVIIIQRY